MTGIMAITGDDIVLALIGALMGLAVTIPVTYLIVDRVVARREKKELAPVERTGIQRLKTKLGPYFLTNYLVTLVVEITRAVEEKKVIPREVAVSYSSKLKDSQNDIEIILDIYNQVLSTRVKELIGAIVLQVEHLEEDFDYVAQIYPKVITPVLASHIQDTTLKTVRVTKETLKELGAESHEIKALEDWLVDFKMRHPTEPHTSQPIEISGGHQIG
ncbi:MAG TPA: hypothetical protein VE177_02205 [Candidatus Binatus sp.]|nr:hypothetical protein [Candidatus Binatus sp.]